MANLIPNTLTLTGADFTGTSGAANRTYDINASGILSGGMIVVVQGATLMSGDYTFSDPTVTLLNILDNSDKVQITFFTEAQAGSGAPTYSSTTNLTRFMKLLGSVPNNSTKTKELVGTGDGSTATFWLANLGVLDDSYTLYYGATEATATTALTETTHYTIDLDISKITLTASGISTVASSKIYATYKFNSEAILDSELSNALIAAEAKIRRDTELVFAEFSATSPGYLKITNELKKAHYDPYDKVYDVYHTPIVKFSTTTNGAFTLGGTSLVLTDATGLPSSGTIYVGGYKVAYTAKSTNTLTVPATTPSIATAATVRGEVVELSIEPEGTTPSYTVLDPDTEYEVDYDNGRVKLLGNAYFGEISAEDVIYPSNYLVRLNYFHAWHDFGQDPEIPDDIEWLAEAIAARRLMGSVVAKAHTTGLNGFNPALVNVDREEIAEVIRRYQVLNVGSSPFNKQSLS